MKIYLIMSLDAFLNEIYPDNKDSTRAIINRGDYNWNHGLYKACEKGSLELVKFTMNNGVFDSNVALRIAFLRKYEDIIFFLIEKGGNINLALSLASRYGYINIAKLMLEKGAKNFDEALANIGYDAEMKEVALLLIEKGAKMSYCKLILELKDIELLYKLNINISSQYQYLLNVYTVTRDESIIVLNDFLIDDLVKIITSY